MPEFYIICKKSWFLSCVSNSSNNDAQWLLDGVVFSLSSPIQLLLKLSASEVRLIYHSSSVTHWIYPSNANQALLRWAASQYGLLYHGITLRNAPSLLSLRKLVAPPVASPSFALLAAGETPSLTAGWRPTERTGTFRGQKRVPLRTFHSIHFSLNCSSVWIFSVCNTNLSPSLRFPFLFNFNVDLSMLKWNMRSSPKRGYQGFEVSASIYHWKHLNWGYKVFK